MRQAWGQSWDLTSFLCCSEAGGGSGESDSPASQCGPEDICKYASPSPHPGVWSRLGEPVPCSPLSSCPILWMQTTEAQRGVLATTQSLGSSPRPFLVLSCSHPTFLFPFPHLVGPHSQPCLSASLPTSSPCPPHHVLPPLFTALRPLKHAESKEGNKPLYVGDCRLGHHPLNHDLRLAPQESL